MSLAANRFAQIAAATSIAILGSVVLVPATSHADPVKERKALMKEVVKNTKLAGGMAKGKIPFDGKQAATSMQVYVTNIAKFVALFPDDSKDDPESEAAPKVWTAKADFEAKAKKFSADAAAAKTAAMAGEAEFKAAFGTVVQNCKGCHQDYRIKKEK